MFTVTSAELQKKFGRYRAIAHREPVSVTSHGNEDVVLLSAEEYGRLKSRDREALYARDLSAADLAALDQATVPAETGSFDSELEEG